MGDALQLRTPTYRQNIVKGAAMTVGAKNQFTTQFPKGPGYYTTRLRLNVQVTNATGASGVVTEGILNFIRQIYYRGDNQDVWVDNLPGRALYKIAAIKAGSPPRKDEFAASVATYRVDIPIYHADPRSVRPEDTILPSGRYKTITMDVVLGPLTDLCSTVGSLAVTVTADIDIIRTKDDWDQKAAPVLWFQCYDSAPLVDANSQTYIDLNKDANTWLKRLYVHSSTGGTAGMPWYGVNADTVLQHLSIQSGDQAFLYQIEWLMLQDANKDDYSLESVLAGVGVIDFMKDESNLSALHTDLNQLRLNWVNATVAANDIITAIQESRKTVHAVKA